MAVTVRALENFVGGEWVQARSDRIREIVSPVTGEVIAEAPDASSADIDRAVVAARAAQPAWAARTAWERAEICHAIADLLIEERLEPFAHALTLEQGKPYASEALPDIDETAENFRIAAEDVKRLETAIVPSARFGQAHPHPSAARRMASTRPSRPGTSRPSSRSS